MSMHITEQLDQGKARIVAAPEQSIERPRHQVDLDRSFELPTGLYMATVGLYFAFLAIMFAGFATQGLIIPMVIFSVFIIGIFGVPAIWTRLNPKNRSQPMSWGKFDHKGIMTHTGRLARRDAAIQMLILPVLIVLWGAAVVTISALLR